MSIDIAKLAEITKLPPETVRLVLNAYLAIEIGELTTLGRVDSHLGTFVAKADGTLDFVRTSEMVRELIAAPDLENLEAAVITALGET